MAEATSQNPGEILVERALTAGHKPHTPSTNLASLKHQRSEHKIIFRNLVSGKRRNCSVKRFTNRLYGSLGASVLMCRGPRLRPAWAAASQLSDRIKENGS